MSELPAVVREARDRASRAGFEFSCDDAVGRLLAVLAASVPLDGRILEVGTGAGVGTAWFVHGLGARSDVDVVTVEVDPQLVTAAQAQRWPAHVRFHCGDAVTMLPSLGLFDLIFADAPGGKWERLDLTVAALAPGGFLLVDDMTPTDRWDAAHGVNQSSVRRALLGHSALIACEMDWATGVILCARGQGRFSSDR